MVQVISVEFTEEELANIISIIEIAYENGIGDDELSFETMQKIDRILGLN